MNDDERMTTGKTVFQGKTYRITILSERLIRLEYNLNGQFLDLPTEFAVNRNFPTPQLKVEEDEKYLEIVSKYFALLYVKEKPFAGPKYAPDANLKIVLKNTDRIWYFDHPEARNFMGTAMEIGENNKRTKLSKGLYSLDGFASIDDSESLVIMNDGTLFKPTERRVDTYVFLYRKDFGLCLQDYFTLTGFPPLVPRYSLGIWWNRDKIYTADDAYLLLKAFNKYKIPISVLLLSEFWHLKDAKDYNLYKTGFTFDTGLFPNPKLFLQNMHEHNVRVGINIDPTEGIMKHEAKYLEIANLLGVNTKKTIPFNIFDKKFLDVYFKILINPLSDLGVDFFWIDYKKDLYSLRALNYYHTKFGRSFDKRSLILSRNSLSASHRYPISYSGETLVSWDTLSYLPRFNSTASNIGVSFWSHDVGGFKNGIEDSELYTRYVEFSTFSPIFRFSARRGMYYKREPWLWDNNTYNIVKDYCLLRHRLIPYLYTEAYNYSKKGLPIIQPLYYYYPEIYDEPFYQNEYYFGEELLIAPITKPKEYVMNRSVERVFLPKGTWYDFKTGKKFLGNKRYVVFYKDEDYPVFAKAGSIIPLSILGDDINSTLNPTDMEIHIFPGKSNVYNLYEDDGITEHYREGFYTITSIDYNYLANNFTVIIRPVEGKTGIIPLKRNYKIRFRNTRKADNVDIFLGKDKAKLPFTSYEDDTDFIVMVSDVDTTSQLTINCRGRDIEIDAVRIVNEDINSIISDLKIETRLKERIAEIIFSDMDIKKKRINIRKLHNEGLEKEFVRMFIKLLEYVSEF